MAYAMLSGELRCVCIWDCMMMMFCVWLKMDGSVLQTLKDDIVELNPFENWNEEEL